MIKLPSRHGQRSSSKLRLALPGKPDSIILILGIILTLLGILVVYDSSSVNAANLYQNQYYFLKLQLIWATAGIILGTVAYFTPISFLKTISRPLFMFNLFLLTIVLIPGIGDQHFGGRRWLTLGWINFQPAEL